MCHCIDNFPFKLIYVHTEQSRPSGAHHLPILGKLVYAFSFPSLTGNQQIIGYLSTRRPFLLSHWNLVSLLEDILKIPGEWQMTYMYPLKHYAHVSLKAQLEMKGTSTFTKLLSLLQNILSQISLSVGPRPDYMHYSKIITMCVPHHSSLKPPDFK